jgi:hypothetical protein
MLSISAAHHYETHSIAAKHPDGITISLPHSVAGSNHAASVGPQRCDASAAACHGGHGRANVGRSASRWAIWDVLATDISANILEFAAMEARAAGLANIETRVMDGSFLLPALSFDLRVRALRARVVRGAAPNDVWVERGATGGDLARD